MSIKDKLQEADAQCKLCIHIPLEYIINILSQQYNDINVIYDIAIKTSEIIKESYNKDKFNMQGKSYKAIMASSIYIASIETNHKLTQRRISKLTGVTEVGLRNNYLNIMMILYPENIWIKKISDYHPNRKKNKTSIVYRAGKHGTNVFLKNKAGEKKQ